MSNFVDIVGFQLEKVHTGVLKWFLETETKETTITEKYNVIESLYKYKSKKPAFKEQDIDSISCIPEWSCGRKIRIDLVIEIKLKQVSKSVWLVFEVKTDSIPYEKQLENTRDTFIKPGDDVEYFLLLVGTSMIFERKFDGRYDFKTITNQELFDIFNCFKNSFKPLTIVIDWTDALRREISRFNNVEANLKNVPDGNLYNRAYWEGYGYRCWFPLFFCIYEKLRKNLDFPGDWEIESGSNNPVMNWKKSWLDINCDNKNYKTYFEFHGDCYCFKVEIDKDKEKIGRDDLNQFRDNMIGGIEKIQGINLSGEISQRRYGKSNTIYKWKCEFGKRNLNEIAGEVNAINKNILPILGGKECPSPWS
jgi:hypothetical protein